MRQSQRLALEPNQAVSLKRILYFFLPLGLASSLVSISHVIIQSTLARSVQPEITIAGYAIASSIFSIAERPAVMLRQTCSRLAQDRLSFRAILHLMNWLIVLTVCFGLIISYTPAGVLIFQKLFNADQPLLKSALSTYRILMFVTVFSALRCLYQGIIIRNFRTKWLTIGMVIRLTTMYLLSLYFIHFHPNIDGSVGAMIFLAGMMVEALVSYVEGRSVLRELPYETGNSEIKKVRDVLPFYRPLIYSSFIAVIIGPSINAMLGKTVDIGLAVASYALALSLTNLVTNFYSYMHQIVLNFYRHDARAVARFASWANLIPSFMIGLLAYTGLGPWVLSDLMGVGDTLMMESLAILKIFMIFTFVFPWVDFCNGLLMLERNTRMMIWSQAGNLMMTVIVLVVAVSLAPAWNGKIGALGQSLGLVMELAVLTFIIRMQSREALSVKFFK